jgi:hypothetical protein
MKQELIRPAPVSNRPRDTLREEEERGLNERQPDVEVLTIAKGRHSHLLRLLEGLSASLVLPARCVVVDLDAEPARLPATPFPLLHHHAPATGLPLAAARNAAAHLAAAPNLIFLDVDCIPAADLVGTLGAMLHRQDALVCCEILYLDATASAAPVQDLARLGQRHPHRPFPTKGSREEPNAGLFWSLAFGIRAGSFAALGGFDTSFTGYGAEDTDFGFRARGHGLPLVLTADTSAFHQYHPVFDPPLQHFDDILANAARFRERHGLWPMDGWLRDFARLGLIEWSPDSDLRLLRRPSPDDIAAAACAPGRAF